MQAPVQISLCELQISTTDGRTKIMGRIGCEVTLFSAASKPFSTRQLEFVTNRGAVLRVCEVRYTILTSFWCNS